MNIVKLLLFVDENCCSRKGKSEAVNFILCAEGKRIHAWRSEHIYKCEESIKRNWVHKIHNAHHFHIDIKTHKNHPFVRSEREDYHLKRHACNIRCNCICVQRAWWKAKTVWQSAPSKVNGILGMKRHKSEARRYICERGRATTAPRDIETV